MKPLPFAALLGLALPFALLTSAASAFQDSPLREQDFAQGIKLTPQTADTVQLLLLPELVYPGLTSANLDDMRIFNATGKEVPFAIRSLMDAERIDHGSLDVPLFPIRAQAGEDLLIGDVSMQLTRSEDGRVLEVISRAGEPTIDRGIAAYILDLGMLERPAVALTLPLPEPVDSFLERYTIETSQDLSTWRELVPQATLASLDRDGTRLLRTRVELPETSSPYLRLRWLDYGPKFELEHATIELQSQAGIAARRTIRLQGAQREGIENGYQFASPGPLPINRIQVNLPEPNTLIQAKVLFAEAADGPWRTALDARFFRTSDDDATINDPYAISTVAAPFWRLHVSAQGGGLGAGVPELELEYYPHQLAFVANGEGPFTLAFGKAGAYSTRLAWSEVTRDLLTAEQSANLSQETVLAGPIFDLAGAAALIPPVQEEGPMKYILWAILLAGVGVLASISLRLVRKL